MQATVTTKGQLTIPKSVRDRMKIEPGDKLDVVALDDDSFVFRRVRRTTLEDLAGIVKYDGPPLSVEDMDSAIEEAVAEKHLRILRESRE